MKSSSSLPRIVKHEDQPERRVDNSDGARVAPLVHISVLNWNGAANTIECLRSLEQLDYSNFVVTVVDNCSSDNSAALIREAFPDIRVIVTDENLGYAGGHKVSVRVAQDQGAALVWLINTDLVINKGTLSELIDAYLDNGEAIYGSLLLHKDGAELSGMRCFALSDEGRLDLNECLLERGQLLPSLAAAVPVASVCGASVLIPLSVVEQFGFMREDFFMYWEDVEYSFRLAREGIPTYLVPRSTVVHTKDGIRQQNEELQQLLHYYELRNRLVMLREFSGLRAHLRELFKHRDIRGWLTVNTKRLRRQELDREEFRSFVKFAAVRDAAVRRLGKTYAPESFLE